jgi:hypothetical protein
LSGDLTLPGDLSFADNAKAIFGAGSDLQIYHDGSNSYVQDAGTGNLFLQGTELQLRANNTMRYLTAVQAAEVKLYYNNAQKLATTSTGIDVTGTATMDGLTTVSTSGNQTVLVDSTGGTSSLQFRTSSGSISNYIRSGTGGSAVLQFMTAGENERMRIDSSGNVLVGKTSASVSTTGSEIRADGQVSVVREGDTPLFVNRKTNDGTIVDFRKDGSTVGNIGTNSGNIYLSDGARSLIVDGDTVKAGYSTGGNADGAQDLGTSSVRWRNLYLSGISYSNTVYSDLNLTLAADYNNDSSTGNSNILFQRATSSGGDSTVLTLHQLNLANGGASLIKIGTENNNFAKGAIGFKRTGDYDRGAIIFCQENTSDNSDVDSSDEVMRIDSSGNVGIGNNSPATKLAVSGGYISQTDGTRTTYLGSDGSGGLLGTTTNHYLRFITNNTERARIDSSGNLLLGKTSQVSAGRFGVQYDSGQHGIGIDQDFSGAGTLINFLVQNSAVGSIQTNGTTTSYNTSSDQRLKDSIVDAPSASDDIDAIQVRSFDWKADGSHQKYGMVAQELQSVAPEAVTGDADSEDMMAVDYSKLVPMMIKEIQSLRREVEALKENN